MWNVSNGFDGYYGFNFFPFFVSLMIPICFLIIIGAFAVMLISGFRTWNKNNHAPRLTVPASVTAKRISVSEHRHHHSGASNSAGSDHFTSSTYYYATFQFDSGNRLELAVSGSEYGMLAEGDTGQLSFQGTRYLGFVRDRKPYP